MNVAVPDIFWDVVTLAPLIALALGTIFQASDSMGRLLDLLPEEELFLRSKNRSMLDLRADWRILFGSHGRGDLDDNASPIVQARRSAQGWMWLQGGALLAAAVQFLKVISWVQSRSTVAAFVILPGSLLIVLFAIRIVEWRKEPQKLPVGTGWVLRSRRRTALIWTLLPFLPLREPSHIRYVERKTSAFVREVYSPDRSWPYWLIPPRTALEPGERQRIVILIQPSEPWSLDFMLLVRDVLKKAELDPRPAHAEGQRLIRLVPGVNDEVTVELNRICWWVRFCRVRDLSDLIMSIDGTLRGMNCAPWMYSSSDRGAAERDSGQNSLTDSPSETAPAVEPSATE